MPVKKTTIRLERFYSAAEMEIIRRGVVPEVMEDKWFIYWLDETLYLHRSWTGVCVFAVRFAAEGEGWRMVEADVNRDPEQYKSTDDAEDAKTVSYLVDVLLLHKDVLFPTDDLAAVGHMINSWVLVGRASVGQHPDR